MKWHARLAAVLVLTFAALSFTTVTTQRESHAVVPVILPVVAAALPFSVVSAGVGGGISLVSTGGALAGAGITAAAALAGNWAVSTLFSWGEDAPEDFGDVEPVPVGTAHLGAQSFAAPRYSGGGVANWTVTVNSWSGISANQATVNWTRHVVETNSEPWYGARCANGGTQVGSKYMAPLNNSTVNQSIGGCSTQGGMVGVVLGAGSGLSPVYAEWATTPPTAPEPTGEPGTAPLTVAPTTKCVDGGGLVQTFAGTILSTTRSTSSPALLTYPACPAGSTVQSRSAPITRTSDGVVQGDALTGATGTSSTPWSPPAVPAAYPDCSGGVCVMTLTRTMPDGSTITCTAAGQCVSYADVVQQWPQVGTGASSVARQAPDGSSYQCRFGAYPVAVAECQVVPGAGLGTSTTPQEDDTRCDWKLSAPWTWPLTAVRCAFVPSSAAVTAAQTEVDAAWTSTGVEAWVDTVAGTGTALGGLDDQAAGCEGPVFAFLLGGNSYRFAPLDACAMPMQGVAVVIKVLIGFYIVIKGARFVARPILSAFGMGQAV